MSPGPAGKVVGKVSRNPHMGGVTRTSKCECRRIQHERAASIARGLKVVRERFSIPRGELPDLEYSELDKYLLYQLKGALRPSVHFPRSQRGYISGIPSLHRLTKRDRWSLAATLASLKRGVDNATCKRHRPQSGFQAWKQNACQVDAPASSPEYLRFVRATCQKIFRFGWDDSYESFCHTFCPKDSGRFEPDGVSASQWWASNQTRQGFLRGTLFGKVEPIEGFKLRYKEIPAVGKVRPMGVPSVDYDYLGPLHKAMYSYISSKEWCLRGSPTSRRINEVCVNPVQTSIDLTSATDGLKIDAAEVILGVALAKSTRIPGAIKVMACDSLRPTAFSKSEILKGKEGTAVTHGQMMGTYLSFPLLCIQSYCAARWATRDCPEARFLANGDDMVISANRPILNSCYPEGFQVNEKKTARSSTFVEINSTQFLKQGKRWSKVPLLRRAACYDRAGSLLHLVKSCIEAGPKWQEAFARSHRNKKGFLPSRVGMDLRLRSVNQLENRLFSRGYYSPPGRVVDPRWEMSEDEPTWGDKVAFNKQLFEEGRWKEDPVCWGWKDCEVFPPSCVIRLSPVPVRIRLLEHELREKKRRVRKLWCYSTKYSRVEPPARWKVEEEDGLLSLVPV